MPHEPAGLRRGPLLIWTALLTAAWTALLLLQRGYAHQGIPFAWRPSGSCSVGPAQPELLILDIALWFALFYMGVRGFALMQTSPFRRPFRRPPQR